MSNINLSVSVESCQNPFSTASDTHLQEAVLQLGQFAPESEEYVLACAEQDARSQAAQVVRQNEENLRVNGALLHLVL